MIEKISFETSNLASVKTHNYHALHTHTHTHTHTDPRIYAVDLIISHTFFCTDI